MSHVVLARKYRPKTFSEVVGQDVIVGTIKASIASGRVAHALLFTGGRGIGKTTIARLVAKAVVCLQPKDAEPCGACSHCVAIDNFSSLDVIEIDGATHTGVDDIRELRDSARYQPASAKYKIFIIDEVHMLSVSAFNALLKILEEPPAHVMFIFATTEAHKIPKTILSRTQRYDFRRMSTDTIFPALKNIMTIENIAVADDGLRLVAKLADGGMRDALSMLEQVLATQEKNYTADMVATALGVVSHNAVKAVVLALINGNVDDALLIVKEIYAKGLDLAQLMDAIAERFRVLSLCAHVEQKHVQSIVPSVDDDDIKLAQSHDKADLKRLFAMAIDGMSQVFAAHKPLYAVELFILRMALRPTMSDAITINYCLQKLDAIMHNRPLPKEPQALAAAMATLAAQNAPAQTPTPARAEMRVSAPAPTRSPIPSTPSPAQKMTPTQASSSAPAQAHATPPVRSESTVDQFAEVVFLLDKTLPALASHLRHARPVMNEHGLTLYFEQSLHHDQTAQLRVNRAFSEAMMKVFGKGIPLKLELKKSSPEVKTVKTVWEAGEEKQRLDEKALYDRAIDHPLVQKAIEIFGGDVTSVKKVGA